MARRNIWKLGLIVLALAGMLIPAPVLQAAGGPAGHTAPGRGAASDVALTTDGTLQGQVVSAQGIGLSGVCVTVSHGAREEISTMSGPDGRFEIRGLKGGVLSVTAGHATMVCRAWTPDVAPPAAADQILLVADQSQALGQGKWKSFFTNPWVIAGIVAAAIAIPVGIHNYNNRRSDPASP